MKNIVFIISGLLIVVQGQTITPNEAYKLRIVNGEDVKLGEIPYQVSLQNNGRHWCGGSILNEYWIVTAAHCAENKLASDFKIVAGTVSLKEVYSLHQAVQIIVHENFAPRDSDRNDIALIKVAEPFEFSFRTQPVILPMPHAKVKTNSTAVVSGWGMTTNGDSGGPVTVDGVLTGIVSWSIKDPECGSTYYPGVHTRVSEYVDWINEHTITIN